MEVAETAKIFPILPKIDRILKPNFKRREYKTRGENEPVSNHWGQRKLFMIEMEFLTKYSCVDQKRKTIVVYAGAAPGSHIDFLAKLFPDCYYILADPSDFQVKRRKNIKIINDYFTHKLAEEIRTEYADRTKYNLLFMSDIRTANWRQMDVEENEEYIKKDNQFQLEWCQIMKPDKAVLKFRLPYQEGVTKYFPGDIYLSPWGPTRTTETRLIPSSYDNDDLIEYDQIKYEEQLYYFNTIARFEKYPHNVRGEGITENYDSAAEIQILYEYLTWKYGTEPDIREISKLSYDISRKIVKGHRTLLNQDNPRKKNKPFLIGGSWIPK